jgi:hypothetical protein
MTTLTLPTRVIDLGGPEGGRYWMVVSDHAADDPDARSAAVHARLTGSVGCTYNDAKVERWSPQLGAVAALDARIATEQEHDRALTHYRGLLGRLQDERAGELCSADSGIQGMLDKMEARKAERAGEGEQ